MFHIVRAVSMSLLVATLATAAALGIGLWSSRQLEQQWEHLGSP